MYQIYSGGFSDGVIGGSRILRLSLKFIYLACFIYALRQYFSLRTFSLNIILKVPILLVSCSIIVLIPFLSDAYFQSVNLIFFLVILFVDWNRIGGFALYKYIWLSITIIVSIQLFIHPLLVYLTHAGWSNSAYIGGMGNPNVFGLFLICSGLACIFLFDHKQFKYVSILFFMATILTGSLISMIVGYICLSAIIGYFMISRPIIGGVFVISIIGITILFNDGYFSHLQSVQHVLAKSVNLWELVSGKYNPDETTSSISVRLEFYKQGIDLMINSPSSILFGHPKYMAMYNGDGLWISYAVTHGLLLTIYFFIVNIILILRGLASKDAGLKFSGIVISVMLLFFITNRMLDYWPAALPYILVVSYLATKRVIAVSWRTINIS